MCVRASARTSSALFLPLRGRAPAARALALAGLRPDWSRLAVVRTRRVRKGERPPACARSRRDRNSTEDVPAEAGTHTRTLPILYLNIHRLAPSLSTTAPETKNARGLPRAASLHLLCGEV